jgi:hypothetical protein
MIDDVSVVFMSANIGTDGTYNVTQTVQDLALYEANKKECDADYKEFKKKVDEIVSKL